MRDPMTSLEVDLRVVGDRLSFPETPDLTTKVMQRIASAPVRTLSPRRFRPGLVAAAAVGLAVALVVFLGTSPSARRAVAGWLGVDGIKITFDDRGSEQQVGSDLSLGSRVSLQDAQGVADFDIATPRALGEPDAYFVRDVAGGEVSIVWGPGPALPASRHTDVGAVLTQFLGDAAPESLKKIAGSATTVTPVLIDGSSGFFIEGAPHLLVRDPSGRERTLSPRLAGNTLVWDAGAITYRLEAEVDLTRALEIARSLEY